MSNRFSLIIFCTLMLGNLFAQTTFPEYSLPLFVIETNNNPVPDEPKLTASLKIINNADGINKPEDAATDYDGFIGIELRGSSSAWFDKKQYGIETRKEDGSNNNVSLLGLPEENDWILYAPYSDKSLMRNALTYALAGEIMDYAPRGVFCEVILNGDYKGVYLLLEKIKRDRERVAISKLTPEDNTGDQLTGGYILKIDKADDIVAEGFTSLYSPFPGRPQDVNVQYHYPKPEDITSAQKDYIRSYFHDFETALNDENFADPESGYRKYMDVNTFIDYQIITELSKNPDGYRISTYLHKDRDSIDSRFKMGPVWDYNLAMGNVNYCTEATTYGWVKDFNSVCPDDFWLIPFWWKRLWQDQEYLKAFKTRWKTLRADQLSDEAVLARVYEMRDIIGTGVDRNFIRWPILAEYIWPNDFIGGNYISELNYLRNWLTDRMEWMDGQIETFGTVNPIAPTGGGYAVFPNPTTLGSTINFEYFAKQTQDISLRVYDNTGRYIMGVIDNQHPTGINKMSLSTNDLGQGFFFYGLWNEGELLHSGPFYID